MRALALVGFLGSGKSTVGRLVAARAGVPHRDLDAIIEASCGMAIAEIFRTRGELAFRALEAQMLSDVLEPGAVASLGGGTPMADPSWELIRREAFAVWLDAPLTTMLERVAPQGHRERPLLEGRSEQQLQALLRSRLPRYACADRRVDAARPADEVAEEVYRLWRA